MMLRLMTFLAAFSLSTLFSTSVFAQNITGRWQLRGTYLKIDYSLKWKIIKMSTPATGYLATPQPLTMELYDDGRVRFGNETDTYTLRGNRLIMGIGGSDSDGFDYELHNNELTLWMSNLVARSPKQNAKAEAIALAKQMKMYEQFPNLNEAEDVTRVQLGMVFDFVDSPRHTARRKPVPNRPYNMGRNEVVTERECIITESEMSNILQKAKDLTFDDEIKNYLTSAVKSKKCFNSSQVLEMLKLLTFDKDKLPLARTAYPFVTDPENYFELEEVFDFTDSKRQFRAMLK